MFEHIRSALSILVLILIPLSTHSQDFSGIIHYKHTIIPKVSPDSMEVEYESLLGDSSTYAITSGYYASKHFKKNRFEYSYTYHDETKYMYDEHHNKSYITYRKSWTAESEGTDRDIKAHRDSTITVLGEKAFLVTSGYNESLNRSYYSLNKRVNIDSFKDHSVGDWNKRLALNNGGILLKSITEYEDYIEIREAVKIDEKKLTKADFKLNEDKKVVASFSALDELPRLNQLSSDQFRCYQSSINRAKSNHKLETYPIIYLTFILQPDGEMESISVFERDEYGFFLDAIDILKNCNLMFLPGLIADKPVASEVYFPVDFSAEF